MLIQFLLLFALGGTKPLVNCIWSVFQLMEGNVWVLSSQDKTVTIHVLYYIFQQILLLQC